MTWSPLPKKVLTALRTVDQWMPSEEYHSAADSLLPLTDDPHAKTPFGVDRMSLTTAPGVVVDDAVGAGQLLPLLAVGRVPHGRTAVDGAPCEQPESARRHGVHHRSTLVGAEVGASKTGLSGIGRKGWPGFLRHPYRGPHGSGRCQPSPPPLHGFPSPSPRSAAAEPSPVGVGRAVLDHRVALGDVHTVATAGPPALNCVPAMSQSALAPGATTADKVLVAPPPRSSARLRVALPGVRLERRRWRCRRGGLLRGGRAWSREGLVSCCGAAGEGTGQEGKGESSAQEARVAGLRRRPAGTLW